MKFDKGLIAGSSTLLVLALLEREDMYGYQMIEELSRRSNDAFQFQEGTLYPILHGLEKGKYLSGYQQQAPSGRMRKYYRLTRKGREPAFRFAGCFITVMGLLSAVLSVLGILFAGPLVSLFADGYDAQTAELAVSLTRVMFPTVLFTGVAFSFVGVLQSLGEFNVPALISVVSNLVIILYYLTLDQQFGIYGLAVAFLVGWFLQAAVQVAHLGGVIVGAFQIDV